MVFQGKYYTEVESMDIYNIYMLNIYILIGKLLMSVKIIFRDMDIVILFYYII